LLAYRYFVNRILGKRIERYIRAYPELRRQYMADPSLTSDRAFEETTEALIVGFDPRFDPRLSSWSRLESAEPRLLAYVTQYIDPSVEEPLDLEAFADGILLTQLSQPPVIGPEHWQLAMDTAKVMATEWRMAQSDRGRIGGRDEAMLDSAMNEAEAVMDRFFRSGDWRWDFQNGVAIDQDIGRDLWRHLTSGQGTNLTPSEGGASADGAALAPELGSSWRWTASGLTPSPSSRQSPSASRLAGDGVFQTRADPTLQLDALAQMLQLIALAQVGPEMGILSEQSPMPRCEDVHVASMVPMDASAWPEEALPAELVVAGTWFEQWTLGCEDTRWTYAVAFMPNPKGGTLLSAKLRE
jgi:hypothetical protein